MKHDESRRQFLKKLASITGGAALLSTQQQFQLIQSALAAKNDYSSLSDYKSLVCVYLYGGNDAFNMFVPNTSSGYQQYVNVRQTLAIRQEYLLPVAGERHAFHPSMSRLRNLYDQKKMALISNVGTLLEPVTRSTLQKQAVQLPPNLYSHSHQAEMWMTGLPPITGKIQHGWGGRMFDLFMQGLKSGDIPPVYSLLGNNEWQSSVTTIPFSINPWDDSTGFNYLSGKKWPKREKSRTTAWENILKLASSHSNPMKQQWASSIGIARERLASFSDAFAHVADIKTSFDNDNHLAMQLRKVAQIISIRKVMGQHRQIFFVGIGGWDTHGQQLTTHADLLSKLDNALYSFQSALAELRLEKSVTSFTASDFGRSLTANGDGTDHAWGTHALVMGGAVNGGQIHGEMPQLVLGGDDDSGNDGRIIPTIALDQYAATLAKWMGVSNSDLNDIFPYLRNFATSDIGFMA